MNRSWRREAKNILYNYQSNMRQCKALENDLILGQGVRRDHRYHGGISDPTAVKILQMDQGELAQLRQQVEAVERLLKKVGAQRRDSRYKLGLLQLVYFRRSHSLYGAAAYLGIPERTAHRWITQMLTWLAEDMGLLEEEE